MDVKSVTMKPKLSVFADLLKPDLKWPKLSVFADLLKPFRDFATRDDRRGEAEFFIDTFAQSDHDYPVIKACTSALGELFWTDKWLGITWVALQGIDSMCVVLREDDLLNLKRMLGSVDVNDPSYFNRLLWNAIISNVEDIEAYKFHGGNPVIPFSVVTVYPSMGCKLSGGQASRAECSAMYRAAKTSKFLQDKMKSGATSTTEKTVEASRAECSAMYRAAKTSKFLQDKMKSGATSTTEKTVETAISALEHLFRQKFEADEIRVFVWKKDKVVGWELPRVRKIPDLEELLATLRAKN